ncbi:MAG: hypothetical protein D6705_10375 [Deltaproteobacteria bacterium]|nr:MAG: hypothetical protein D6705_10375 [Deltaproteobacteria bacterium]
MAREDIDLDHLDVRRAPEASGTGPVTSPDGVIIVVRQAFGPTGESLVGVSDVTFDGYPAITVGVRTSDGEGFVHLSPIHGDRRKQTDLAIEPGTKCELFCPVSREPLHRVGRVVEGEDAEYYAIYLTPKLDRGSAIYVSDVWGHYHSRIVDEGELISAWAASVDK